MAAPRKTPAKKKPAAKKPPSHLRQAILDRTAANRETVIKALEQGHNFNKSAEIAGVSWRTVAEWRMIDPAFAKTSDEAYKRGTDRFRDEVRRRSIDGWDEPVFYQGQPVGHIRKFSDTLLMFEMKRRDPEYRDRASIEHSGGIDITKLVAELDQKPGGDK